MRNARESAFPMEYESTEWHYGDRLEKKWTSPGLTKREYFAAMAMSGLLAKDARWCAQLEAKEAVEYADALLAELEKPHA